MTANLPVVPENITVHLGAPGDNGQNVTVPFNAYIKNVASNEIYPTWPESALRANIYAQISFALNRVYTEYYRSRGYNFDITNDTQLDQSFVYGHEIYENISQIVDEIFNSYVHKDNAVEPLFAQYCDGIVTKCDGLSQWGTVDLAEEGKTPYEILQYYYGPNILIVEDAPIAEPGKSAPDVPLSLGLANDDVRRVQIRLNRISKNYPAIPKIPIADGYFDEATEAAVKAFQNIFDLVEDGIVGNATWYSIQRIYNSVKRLSDLNSEGIEYEEVTKEYADAIEEGDRGVTVSTLQYFLRYIANFIPSIYSLTVDGIFGPLTKQSVLSFQKTFGLAETGVVDTVTWREIYNVYTGLLSSIPTEYTEGATVPYPGYILRVGSDNDYVRLLQEYLNYIGRTFTDIPSVPTTGYFGALTYNAVEAFQNLFDLRLDQPGQVALPTWNAVTRVYEDLYSGNSVSIGQYPGYIIS
ncbi:MAG: peptidoglycan-binding protein [Clostridia bacterium]|nr:peptidoglycan-binding protein [Clostridia bacterium]